MRVRSGSCSQNRSVQLSTSATSWRRSCSKGLTSTSGRDRDRQAGSRKMPPEAVSSSRPEIPDGWLRIFVVRPAQRSTR